MTNTVQRIILFLVAMPAIAALIIFVPWYGNVGIIALLTLVGFLCGLELRRILGNTAPMLPRWTVLIPGLAPILSWLVNMNWVPSFIPVYALLFLVLWALIGPVFSREGELPNGFAKISSRMLLVMYPTFLIWWVARLTWFPDTPIVLLVFMLAVFLNDSGAWLFGVTIGRHRGIFPVSPNKSVEGFFGGIFASVLVLVVASFIVPDVIPHPLWQLIIFGLIIGISVIAGDLSESALKRAVGVKDSGNVILGRGGMLDSMDSVLFAAPVFVLFLEVARF